MRKWLEMVFGVKWNEQNADCDYLHGELKQLKMLKSDADMMMLFGWIEFKITMRHS